MIFVFYMKKQTEEDRLRRFVSRQTFSQHVIYIYTKLTTISTLTDIYIICSQSDIWRDRESVHGKLSEITFYYTSSQTSLSTSIHKPSFNHTHLSLNQTDRQSDRERERERDRGRVEEYADTTHLFCFFFKISKLWSLQRLVRWSYR